MQRIVVGVDLTPGWPTVVRQALAFARSSGARLEVVACVGGDTSSKYRQVVSNEISAAVTPYTEGVAVDVRVVVGVPHQVLREAGLEADLLIVGARGTSAGRRLILGTTAQALLHGHGCPVLVVRDIDRSPMPIAVGPERPEAAGTNSGRTGPGGPVTSAAVPIP